MGLSKEEIGDHWQRLIKPSTQQVVASLGRGVVDHVSEALFRVLTAYDASRGASIDTWCRGKIVRAVIDIDREINGRKSSAKYQAIKTSSHDLENRDDLQSSPEESGEEAEELQTVMKTIRQMRGLPRWMLLGRVLGEFKNHELTRMLDVSERQLCREVAGLRQLLRAG